MIIWLNLLGDCGILGFVVMWICCEELEDKFVDIGFGMFLWVFIDEFFDFVNIGEDDLYRFFFMDEELCNFDVDMFYFEMNVLEI